MKQDTTKSVKQVFDDCFESAINTIAQQGGFVYFTEKMQFHYFSIIHN